MASSASTIKLTYLENNGWLWDVNGLKILADPFLVGDLDFGMPSIYVASKKYLKDFQLSDLLEIDCVLITQKIADHCHVNTLKSLSDMFPGIRVVTTPNADYLLNPIFSNVTYLEPGESCEVQGKIGSKVKIRATPGHKGLPWKRPENGYIITSLQDEMTLYFEPHCIYNKELEKEQADIIITPVIKLMLSRLTLIPGQEDAVKLATLLKAKFVVPMHNGDLDAKGLLPKYSRTVGTVESFKELLSEGTRTNAWCTATNSTTSYCPRDVIARVSYCERISFRFLLLLLLNTSQELVC